MSPAKEGREPQSYGSEGDWVTGKTGNHPHDPAAPAPGGDFYESRHEGDESPRPQGGLPSEAQLVEGLSTAPPLPTSPDAIDDPVGGITALPSGAKRGSFFRKRDYEA